MVKNLDKDENLPLILWNMDGNEAKQLIVLI